MKNILVPVDFSENSKVAAIYALEMGDYFNGRVVFHHVLKKAKPDANISELREEYRHKLRDFADALVRSLELKKVQTGVSVNIAPKIESIQGLEQLVFTDIVVMGTKGQGRSKGRFLGKNTKAVVDHLSIPVLVIPEGAKFKAMKKILLCSDYNPVSSLEVFYPVKKFAQEFDSEVRIAHVKTNNNPPQDEHINESREEGGYFGDEVKHSFKLIRRPDVIEGIEFYLNLKQDNDVVAILSREHGLFHRIMKNSHTHKLTYHNDLPLLVLKDRAYTPVE